MSLGTPRRRGEAYEGKGYGTRRLHLLRNARVHIEKSISDGYYCEAIAIIESVITDRLESRLSYLTGENKGFLNLGWAIKQLEEQETDEKVRTILRDLNAWRVKRNGALHELVKIEAGTTAPQSDPDWEWKQRIASMSSDAVEGYELLKRIYLRVAQLNDRHWDQVFPYPDGEHE